MIGDRSILLPLSEMSFTMAAVNADRADAG
jgi:hypothetical protein